jgi:hypothetical protein
MGGRPFLHKIRASLYSRLIGGKRLTYGWDMYKCQNGPGGKRAIVLQKDFRLALPLSWLDCGTLSDDLHKLRFDE